METRTGPLDGVKVIEVASLAPAPFGCMVLADLGADVLRIDRPDRSGRQQLPPLDPLSRGRRSIRLDLKNPAGLDILLRLVAGAAVLAPAGHPGEDQPWVPLGADRGPEAEPFRDARPERLHQDVRARHQAEQDVHARRWTRSTFAPRSARTMQPNGAGARLATSTTLTPSRGPVRVSTQLACHAAHRPAAGCLGERWGPG